MRSKIISIVFQCPLLVLLNIGEILSEICPDSLEQQASKASYYNEDAGSWLGVKLGAQTNGGLLDERYAFSMSCEIRTRGNLSLVVDYHIFYNRQYVNNGLQDIALYSTQSIASIGPKIRFNLKNWSIGLGTGIGSGLYLNPISLYYSGNIEYFLGQNYSLSLNHRKYWFPEINHFFLIGFSKRF